MLICIHIFSMMIRVSILLCSLFSTVAIKVVVAPFTISYYTYKAYSGSVDFKRE